MTIDPCWRPPAGIDPSMRMYVCSKGHFIYRLTREVAGQAQLLYTSASTI